MNYIDRKKLNECVKILGWVEDRDLSTLYKYSELMVFPSLHEGFGFPVVEAFSQGVPVVSSDAFSLKEIGEGAALFVKPLDPQDYVRKILRIIKNNKLRKTLIKKGLKRSRHFSWEKSARETVTVYNSVGNKKNAK
jgi:glycosyltransferase involved in cell wall biosynthesis